MSPQDHSIKRTLKVDEALFDRENSVRDPLINKILIVTAITASVAVCAAELRGLTTGIGWAARDFIQVSTVGCIVLLAYLRKRAAVQFKAGSLIFLLTAGGVSGTYAFGMLGGTVWIFPVAVVIGAIFYSKFVTRAYIGLALLFFTYTAIRFCMESATFHFNSNQLLSNPYHWFVYILCLLTSFFITCVTIQNYRKAMHLLIDKTITQSDELKQMNESLLNALADVRTLSGMLPICASCKKIRDDQGYWNQLETYIEKHAGATFSHGICPDCAKKLYGDLCK